MSYLSDKQPCSLCGDLFDLDQLNLNNVCRDCLIDDDMLDELIDDQIREARLEIEP